MKSVNNNFKEELLKYVPETQPSSLLKRSLYILYTLKELNYKNYISSYKIARIMNTELGWAGSPQGVYTSLSNAPKDFVKRRKREFIILNEGIKSLFSETPTVLLINNSTPFTSKNMFTDIVINDLSGTVLLCDPYINEHTLDLLLKGKKGHKFQILTENLTESNSGSFKRMLVDVQKQGFDVEIRLLSSSTLHDRYLIDDTYVWLIGHSIKDLGKKDCFIIRLPAGIRESVHSNFIFNWGNAKSIL